MLFAIRASNATILYLVAIPWVEDASCGKGDQLTVEELICLPKGGCVVTRIVPCGESMRASIWAVRGDYSTYTARIHKLF